MTKHRTKLYEGMYILNATLSEESRKKALDKITHGIEEKQGKIHKIHDQGRQKLAYQINGKREGYYYIIYFSTFTSVINELWQEYHLHEDLIRFMTVTTDKVIEEKIEFTSVNQGAKR
jgi:small subunit ribosomal protein S6